MGGDMIETVLKASSALDAWLREHLGRPYLAALGVGLVLGIIATVRELVDDIGSESVLKLLLFVAFQAALLVNQLAQFHDYRRERQERKAAKAAAQAGRGGGDPQAVRGQISGGQIPGAQLESSQVAMAPVDRPAAERLSIEGERP
jgi:hypothetical protein